MYLRSKITCDKNTKIWSKNLKKERNSANLISSLDSLSNIPKEMEIIGRFKCLYTKDKCKLTRINQITNELILLNNKLKINSLSYHTIQQKLIRLILKFEKYLKRPKKKMFHKDFDTSSNSDPKPNQRKIVNESDTDQYQSGNDDDDDINQDPSFEQSSRQQHNAKKLSFAMSKNIIVDAGLSTRKTSEIFKKVADCGVEFPTPSQSTIWRNFQKIAKNKELELKETLNKEKWCLHFDGKKINKKEVEVIVLKNAEREIKLAVLLLDDGKSLTIFKGIMDTIQKFNIESAVKMIVCDTTAVNTGRTSGVVARIQNFYKNKLMNPPQYIGCQHHILDLILRHILDEKFGGSTSSPNIEYKFVTDLVTNYETLKNNFKQTTKKIEMPKITWRSDMQFLKELTIYFNFFTKNKSFPFIKFRSLPALCNSRWNSRAILAILAYILIPIYRSELQNVCEFISGVFSEIWFSKQCFMDETYSKLNKELLNFSKAHQCFLKHWVKEDSVLLNVERSNICAERAIKVVQDLYPRCKTVSSLNLKFIVHK